MKKYIKQIHGREVHFVLDEMFVPMTECSKLARVRVEEGLPEPVDIVSYYFSDTKDGVVVNCVIDEHEAAVMMGKEVIGGVQHLITLCGLFPNCEAHQNEVVDNIRMVFKEYIIDTERSFIHGH